MSGFRRTARRLFDLISGSRRDRDFSAELESHVQLHVDDNVRAGMTPIAARRRALIALGGVEQARERHRDHAGFRSLTDLGRDIRLTCRGLLRTPGFTIAAVLTLGVGIGAHTAVFSVVDGMVFRPSPFRDAERLVQVVRARGGGAWSPSIERTLFETLVANTDIFEGVGTYRLMGRMKLAETGGEEVRAGHVTPGFFRFLGIAPAIGREFDASDLDSHAVIVSYPFWRRVLGEDPDPVGNTITLEGRPYVVVGVMPKGVRFPVTDVAQVWLPAPASADFVTTVARLPPGLSIEEAQRRLDLVSTRLQERTPRKDGWGAMIKSEYHLRLPAAATALFLLLVGAVGLVVLIACANVATLFLGRTLGRMKELEVRAAFVDAASLILPPELGEPQLDLRAVFFAAAIVIVAAVGSAAGPFLRVRRHDFSRVISSSRPTGQRSREARWYRRLVAAELSLTCVLLVGTGLLTNSFIRLITVDVGFETENLVLVTIQLADDRH